MKTLMKEIGAALLLGSILPGLMINISAVMLKQSVSEEIQGEIRQVPGEEFFVSIRNTSGNPERMGMQAYLTGVLLGEMPADFELEALKAQAVAARTYTAKAMLTGGKHGDGSLCMDHTCCQAFISEEEYLSAGGTEENLEKVRGAVWDTMDYVLTHQGGLIEATYFSCSGGSTEDAAAVWGTDYPYLKAVPSPGEEAAAHYSDTVCVTPQAFQTKLGRILPGKPASWFGITARTSGGGVETMIIGGETYTGTDLRRLFSLPSTAFRVSVEEDTIVFTTRGYGHRVGMSQYGADAMAVTGSSFSEILEHYYPGTQLERLSDREGFPVS